MAERRDTTCCSRLLAVIPAGAELLDLLHAARRPHAQHLCEYLDNTRQGVTQHLDLAGIGKPCPRPCGAVREKLHFLNPVPQQAINERWIAKFEKPRLKALSNLKTTTGEIQWLNQTYV
jgi:hypothetical protein